MFEDKQKQQEGSQKDRKNWLEWTVFAFSLMLLLTIIGYLGYKTYTHQPSSPDLMVRSLPDPSNNAPNRYHVILENKGGATAEEVIIELVLIKAGKETEKAQLQIPFAPQASKREGWVGFTSSPSEADTLITRVVSYKKP